MKIKIHYYSGAGNLFSIFDNRKSIISQDKLPNFSKLVCSKFSRDAIKTEGLIAIENSSNYPFKVQFFNPDGTSGMMCGNGARCAIAFARSIGMLDNFSISETFHFQLADAVYSARILGNSYQVDFDFPKQVRNDLIINLKNNLKINSDFIDIGTPHLLINYDKINSNSMDFDNFDLINFAKPLRYNTILFPNGTNVSIYKIKTDNLVRLRTYERGVEAETGACGTASVSLGYLLFSKKLCNDPITIIPTSQIPLIIHYSEKNIILEGPAEKIGEKEIEFFGD